MKWASKVHQFKYSSQKTDSGVYNVPPPTKNTPPPGPDRAKTFNMITNKNEAKAKTEQISCDCKFKFNSTKCNSKQKWNNKATKHVNVNVKIFLKVKKIIV